MLGVNQSDFMSYMSALKSNYRKGVHRMEAILSNPTHAKEFAANLGGVSVVLGVPVNLPDRNSDKLLELLLGSDVADDAVETWLHQFYEFTGWDDLLSDSARCKEMANNPLIWRAAGGSKLAVGKSIATLAGLSCADYADIDAVAASQVAMTAIQKSQTALNAIAASSMATAKYAAGAAGLNPADYADMTAIAASQVAMAAVASSQVAMAAIIGNSTALNAVVTSQVAMAAIVKSPVAMAAMWRSDTAIKALQANATAWKTFTGASSAVMGKTVAILANLDPSGYADMTAVASSQVAMAAVIGNATALNAVVTSSVAMAAIAGSGKARVAITNSSGALAALASSSLKKSVSTSACNGNYAKLVTNGPCFIISATHNNSGWTFGVRYVYTSETASGAKTYSSTGSAQSINLFTTSAGLEAFANANSSTSGQVTFVYIPCKAA